MSDDHAFGSQTGDMAADEFRRHALELADWIAAYLTAGDYPVLAQVKPGDIRRALPTHPPELGCAFDEIFTDFEQILLPGITHWNHPGFFGYFAITGSAPGVLAEFLAAALNVQAMLWRTSPAATELEAVALSWLRQLLGLPERFDGVIYDTASISSLHALAAARQVAVPDVRDRGLAGRPDVGPLRVYASEQAHSSIDKAAITLGLGRDAVIRIETDDEFRLRPGSLREAIARDRHHGRQPIAVVATVGTTSTTSIDPVSEVASICQSENLWLHVDAAYAGVAAIVPETADVLDGCDRADSIVVNPHKWLFTPFDLSAFYCARMSVIRDTFSLTPEYLATPEDATVTNLMDTGIQLGRRFRALKLWAVLRYYGASGIRSCLSEHLRLARGFADWIDASEGFERLAPVPLSVVCFRARSRPGTSAADENDLNRRILEEVNASGEVFLSHTQLGDTYALRLAIGHIRTTESHVRLAWELLQRAAERHRPGRLASTPPPA